MKRFGNIAKKHGFFAPAAVIFLLPQTSFATELGDGNAKAEGTVRLATISRDNAGTLSDTYATAAGAMVNLSSPSYHGFSAAVAAYGSLKFPFASGSYAEGTLNPDFFDASGGSFAYLGEGYLRYARKDGIEILLGRQQIHTPLILSSDIRLLPDTFEGAVGRYDWSENIRLEGGYVRRWAGYDSGSDISRFKPTFDAGGSSVMAGLHASWEDAAVQGWGYRFGDVADAVYADAVYTAALSPTDTVELSVQGAHFYEREGGDGTKSGVQGSLYGLQAKYVHPQVVLAFAYNQAINEEGKAVINGLGNGPYYTSKEEWSLSGMEDGRAACFSVEIPIRHGWGEGLTLAANYETFKSTPARTDVREWDLIAMYEYGDRIRADASYVIIDDRFSDGGTDQGYHRVLMRMHYMF